MTLCDTCRTVHNTSQNLLGGVIVCAYKQRVMTYSELLQVIIRMSPEQLKQDATVYDISGDEYYPIYDVKYNVDDHILDPDHPYFTF